MSPLQGAATLPKCFHYDGNERDPRTPEPSATGDEAEQPPPPRPRLRLKKRNVSSHLNAPTQQFLASVAAADVPIQSVEEPEIADSEMLDTLPQVHLQDYDGMDVYQRLRARNFSPPKTPALELASSLPPTKYPNWSIDSWSDSDMESSPEYESRPSTAFSTQSSSSLFSQYSHGSDDGLISPELDSGDFTKSELQHDEDYLLNGKPRKAPWTQAMNSHLWWTYSLYLQDPRVTPIRLGKSSIPPGGVCSRVAREAKKSWKGAPSSSAKSGSSTPTIETSKPFIQWPHTPAATRAHLRELCRLKAASKPGRSSNTARSPTPFNKAALRRWNRRSTPGPTPSAFSAQDMAISLTLSTSEAMQPQGPLAQLSSSNFESPVALPALAESEMGTSTSENSRSERTRLGSPFFVRSCGPSSSSSLAVNMDLRQQSQTLGPSKVLKSPVRLSRSQSGTQKRRSIKGLDDQPRKRPSLAAALWGSPPDTSESVIIPVSRGVNEAQFSSTNTAESDNLFIPRTELPDPFVTSGSIPQDMNFGRTASRPARLGSPFSGSNSSHSFPNRLSRPDDFNLSALRRPFATVQHATDPSSEAVSTRSSLASRLAYIDQRLKEFRTGGTIGRRSQSPL